MNQVRQAVEYLLCDIEDNLGTSHAGDKALIGKIGDKIPEFLNQFRKHLLSSVEGGHWTPFRPGFPDLTEERAAVLAAYGERFLISVIRMIFDENEGWRVSHQPSVRAFDCAYQLGSLLQKLGARDVSMALECAAFRRYQADEDAVREINLEGHVEMLGLARELLERHFLCYMSRISAACKHGPGAVSEGSLPPGEKYRFTRTPELSLYWPSLSDSPREGKDNLRPQPEHNVRVSRMCFVPKDRDKCRVICAEPSLMQYLQQGLRGPLYEAIRVSHVDMNLYDQTLNAGVARLASEYGDYATLDLQSASDRLSLDLVGSIFPTPLFARWCAARSTHTSWAMRGKKPGPIVLELAKFGSMGNALTFPVQSLTFWALICAARMLAGDRERDAVFDTWVYGDDIICPTRHVKTACVALESCGLQVNVDKSFSRGWFRESCGEHAFKGVSCIPAYLRSLSLDPESLVSIVACARALDVKSFGKTSEFLYTLVERALGRVLPVSQRADAMARHAHEWVPTVDLIRINLERGFRIKQGPLGRPHVNAFMLGPSRDRKGRVKYGYHEFDNSWDMWDYRGSNPPVTDKDGELVSRDRGLFARGKELTQVLVPLEL